MEDNVREICEATFLEKKKELEPVFRRYEERIASLEQEVKMLREGNYVGNRNGMKLNQLSEAEMRQLCGLELGEWLIYENKKRYNFLYRVHLDGTDNQPVTNYPVEFGGGWVDSEHGIVGYYDEEGQGFYIEELTKSGYIICDPLDSWKVRYIEQGYNPWGPFGGGADEAENEGKIEDEDDEVPHQEQERHSLIQKQYDLMLGNYWRNPEEEFRRKVLERSREMLERVI